MRTTTWHVTSEPHGEVREGIEVQRIERPVLHQVAKHVQIGIRLGRERPVRLNLGEAMALREALVQAIAGVEGNSEAGAEAVRPVQGQSEVPDQDIPPERKALIQSAVVYATVSGVDRQATQLALEDFGLKLTEREAYFVWRYVP